MCLVAERNTPTSPMAALAGWRGKISETLKNVVAPLSDPSQKRLQDLCDRATSEQLASPDWALNLEIVDAINNDPTCDGGR